MSADRPWVACGCHPLASIDRGGCERAIRAALAHSDYCCLLSLDRQRLTRLVLRDSVATLPIHKFQAVVAQTNDLFSNGTS